MLIAQNLYSSVLWCSQEGEKEPGTYQLHVHALDLL